MAGLGDVADVWKNLKEADLRPILQSAVEPLRIALVGWPDAGVQTLATQLRTDPYRAGQATATPLLIATPEAQTDLKGAELIIVVISSNARDATKEQECAARWQRTGVPVLTVINDDPALARAAPATSFWLKGPFLDGSVTDTTFLERELVPEILEALPERHVALARQLPLLRATVARRLIEEVSLSNATYSLTTGLAGIIPLLNIPLNVTDMVVLTKAQAFMVYRLGLALGLSTRWQDYIREFGSVIGGGFMWRQLARTLVGFIPWLGIVPKVVVAYSGTFVVGNVIWHWYLTGRHLSGEQLKAVYRQAVETGKGVARELTARLPRKRARGRRELAAPDERQKSTQPLLMSGADRGPRYCRFCGRPLPPGATACAFCHAPVTAARGDTEPFQEHEPLSPTRRLPRLSLPSWWPRRKPRA